ncbi:MAG: FxLYD domain-containing protein [Nitrososphaeraceae archaeon]
MSLLQPQAMMMTTLIMLLFIISSITMNTEALAQKQSPVNQSHSGTIDLEIRGVSAFVPEGRNIYSITGEVFNNNTFPFNSVQVSATLYDKNDQVVGVGSGFTSPSGIQPGLKAPFKIDIFGTEIMGGIDAINNSTLQVTGDLQVQLFQ